jgi:hypothetical protein
MPTDYRKYRKDLTSLLKLTRKLYFDMERFVMQQGDKNEEEPGASFLSYYQNWYTESHAFIAQVMPARLPEFDALYMGDEKRKDVNPDTYAIRDWFLNARIFPIRVSASKKREYAAMVLKRFQIQCRILESAAESFKKLLNELESSLSDPSRRSSEEAAVQASLDINRIIVENKEKLFADGDASFWEDGFSDESGKEEMYEYSETGQKRLCPLGITGE